MFIALKGTYFCILFDFTAADVVPRGGRKTSPRKSTIMQFIFHFWSFEISESSLRDQKITIGLDSYSRLFIYLDLIWIYISVFVPTAYLKFTKLQYVFLLFLLQGHYRLTDEDIYKYLKLRTSMSHLHSLECVHCS